MLASDMLRWFESANPNLSDACPSPHGIYARCLNHAFAVGMEAKVGGRDVGDNLVCLLTNWGLAAKRQVRVGDGSLALSLIWINAPDSYANKLPDKRGQEDLLESSLRSAWSYSEA